MPTEEYRVTAGPGCYLVTGPDGSFRVSKHKTCSCDADGVDYCPHVLAVARYLRHGGSRAPDQPDKPNPPAVPGRKAFALEDPRPLYVVGRRVPSASHPAHSPAGHRFWFTPDACPICGEQVAPERVSSARRGPGWRCSRGGLAHFYRVRYGHLRAYMTGVALPYEPRVVAIADSPGGQCWEAQMPDSGIHIVGAALLPDGRGKEAFCYTCNTNRCEAATHVRDLGLIPAFAFPSPVEQTALAAA